MPSQPMPSQPMPTGAPPVSSSRREAVAHAPSPGAAPLDERRRLRNHALAALVNVVLICLLGFLIYFMATSRW